MTETSHKTRPASAEFSDEVLESVAIFPTSASEAVCRAA